MKAALFYVVFTAGENSAVPMVLEKTTQHVNIVLVLYRGKAQYGPTILIALQSLALGIKCHHIVRLMKMNPFAELLRL